VYVPDGTFSVGNNGSAGATINRPFYKMGSPNTSYEITSEALISSSGTGGSSGQLIHPEWGTNNLIPIPAAFPKGYAGFYCMKYEASQQHWVDYLNSLTSAQQANMPTTAMSRNGISSSAGVYSTSLPFVAMNGVYWPDVAAYLDWSGLRVMTEFEFEKACRGTATVVTDEFAWGNTTYTTHSNTTPTNAGLTNEVSAVSGANTALGIANFGGTSPLRAGSFATSSTTRSQSGATFYGIMDMTGNVCEQVATTINYQGTVSTYTGMHGNGLLTSSGYADVSNWPGLSSGFISTTGLAASATACRGGSWFLGSANYGRVADRFWNTIDRTSGLSINRGDPQNYEKGVRGVHTKPITASETK
jgi:formylglycine-generating enzyme required for sulfatase activity